MLLPFGTTLVDPDRPGVKSAHRIWTCVQSAVSGISFFVGFLHVSAGPGDVPPPAGFVVGIPVLSIVMLNENTPDEVEPRTQNEIPLYADPSAHPIQMPPPMPHVLAAMTD